MKKTRVQGLLDSLDAHRATLRAAVDSVPAALRERRPAPDRWSVAENLEHLAIVEQRVADLLAARLTAAKAAGLGAAPDGGDATGVFDPSRVVDRSRRVKTGEASEPTSGLSADEAWARLERSRIALRDLLLAGDGLALHEITHPHPLFGPLNLYDWVAFLGGHDARHAAQIREAGEALASTSR